jgi:AAA domain
MTAQVIRLNAKEGNHDALQQRLEAERPPAPPKGTKAVEFLQQLAPGRAWVLTAIVPDGSTTTETFEGDEDARRFIARHNSAGSGVYYSLNPTKATLRTKASKADIAAIEFLHVDCDPDKDETPEACKARVLKRVAAYEHDPTFVVDSGNGLQLLWRLDQVVPLNSADDIADIEARNYALAEAFNATPSTRNVDRILRLPGTTNFPNAAKRKLGRVKCRARLLQVNDRSYRLRLFPPKPSTTPTNNNSDAAPIAEMPRNVQALLFHRGAKGQRVAGYKDRNALTFAFLTGAIRAGVPDAAIIDACLDSNFAGCAVYEHIKDNGRRKCAERQLQRAREKAGEYRNKAAANTVVAINAEALRTTEFAPIKYTVPGYIVEGVTILAGKPKVGKSWLLLGTAIAVASGTKTLNESCIQGDVLYCALEDNPRRLKSRMKKLLGGLNQPWPKRLDFWTRMPRLGDGGLEKLKEWIVQAKRPRLISLDTLAKVKARAKKEQQSAYDADYDAISDLRDFAGKYGVAIILAHHLRKLDADDPFDTVSGTLGLTGAADSILVLKRGQGQVVLYGKGRDLPDFEKAVEFDKERCTWTVKGDAKTVQVSEQRQAVIDAMRRVGGVLTPKVIEYETGMQAGNVRWLLHMLAQDGDIVREGRGRYRLR